MRAFFAALAIPLTAAVMLALSAVAFGPRGPLVALMLNAFLLSEVAGVTRVFALPMPSGWVDTAVWLTLFNLMFNGYPVMLQRYNRLRLEPLLRSGRSKHEAVL